MLTQNIEFEDIHGEDVKRDFYFNITKLEAIELEIQFDGGLEGHMKKLQATQDGPTAYNLFKDIVLSAYGKPTDDGGFTKKDALGNPLRHQFEASPALSELIVGFLQNPEKGAAFIEGCLPQKLVKQAQEEAKKRKETPAVAELPTAAPQLADEPERKFEDYSREDLLQMSDEAFSALVPSKALDMTPQQLQIAMERKNSA